MFAASKTDSASTGGYQISRSLRFNSADSAYLNRTPASAGNRRTWTFSTWVKRSQLSSGNAMLATVSGSAFNYFSFGTSSGDWLTFAYFDGASDVFGVNTSGTSVFRDVSAWYHIVLSVDTTQATAANRVKIYVNNVEQTLGGTYPTQNYDTPINNTISNLIGGATGSYTAYLSDQYMTEINFIDGSQLTPSSFGETNAQTGVWQPKAYSGSYGTNGFYLNFSDNSNTTAATLGKDYSGNGNNWTPNNFSVTAGAGNDSLVDSPTSYGTDTGVGGEVRGNYSTMNPLDNYNTSAAVAFTFANGNLDVSRSNQSWASSRSTMAMSSGKWYAEMTVTASTAGTLNAMFGIAKQDFTINDFFSGQIGGYGYNAANGQKYNNGGGSAYGATFTTNDVIGVAYDADAGSLVFYKNGTSQGTAYTGLSGTFCFAIGLFPQTSGSITVTLNCGQRPFAYTAPSGFKALCTQNLPTPTIGATTATQAGKFFTPLLWTATGTTQSITGVGFQPDFLWIKDRQNANGHRLQNIVGGASKYLASDSTNAETTDANFVASIDSDGWSMGSGNYGAGRSLVAWNWKANGSGSTNTSGILTSQVSANTTAGFSVCTYTAPASSQANSFGHGLGVAPSMVLAKNRSSGTGGLGWAVYHSSLGANQVLSLNSTAASATVSGYWGSGMTSTVVGLPTGASSTGFDNCTGNMVAYCFAEVAGYSKAFSYTANGSTDGPFVYLGFRPAFILLKGATVTGAWWLIDCKRSTYNLVDKLLFANLSNAEDTYGSVDLLSNGFKIRNNNSDDNTGTYTYIGMAFAEFPFKYSLAR